VRLSWEAAARRRIPPLWEDTQAGAEARLVRELDRLEMALQALVYGKEGLVEMDPFIQSAEGAIHSTQLREALEAIQNIVKNDF
jgi:putative hydrolase of HD superfamily